jgi:hypothetical protein
MELECIRQWHLYLSHNFLELIYHSEISLPSCKYLKILIETQFMKFSFKNRITAVAASVGTVNLNDFLKRWFANNENTFENILGWRTSSELLLKYD